MFRVDLAAARVYEQWFCQSARWNGQSWEAEQGWYRSFPEPGAAGDYRRFEKEEITVFDRPDSFTRRERTLVAGSDLPQQASIAELDDQITTLGKSGYDTTELRVVEEIRRRLEFLSAVGLVLAIVFWATAAIFNALGLETILPPLLAAWSPNVFFATVGLFFLLYAPT